MPPASSTCMAYRRPGPADRHVGIRPVRSSYVVEILQLIGDRDLDGIELGDLIGGSDHRPLGAVAVIATDVNDQRVVELAHVIDRLDYPTDLVIGVGRIGGKHI